MTQHHELPPARRPWWRRLVGGVAILLLVAVAVVSAARLTGVEPGPVALVVAFTPFVALVAVAALLLALLSRRRGLVVVAAALVALNAWWQLPVLVPDQVGSTFGLTVATVNLKYGQADAADVVDLVRTGDVDLLSLQELTPEGVEALAAAGLDELLPYREVHPDPSFTGTGIWSRTPLRNARLLPGYTSTTIAVETTMATRLAGENAALTVVAVHPAAPGLSGHEQWSRDLAALAVDLDSLAGAVVVAGDFNATRDNAPFRALEGIRYLDATDQAGAGYPFSYRDGGQRVPPLVAIDHVLTRGAGLVATSTVAVSIAGSDHRGLLVRYA